MIAVLVVNLLVFVGLNFGLAGLVALRLGPARPLARLVLGLAIALTIQFLAGFALYAAGLDWVWLALLPAGTALLAWKDRQELAVLLSSAEVRRVLAGWALVALWSLGFHALIVSYSGGGWGGDQLEHYERVRFFLERWPLNFRFLGLYGLPARPPMANVMIAGWMSCGGGRYVDFQVFSTLLSSLAFLPLALLVRRLGGGRAGSDWLALLLMLNPMWMQNSTFPWTKLAAAFFILLAVEHGLAGLKSGRGHGKTCLLLGIGLLTHYSTGPWAIALGAAWAWSTRRQWRFPGYWREVLAGLLGTAALTMVWFGWAGRHYGFSAIAGETSTVAHHTATGPGQFAHELLANIRYTLVPASDSPIQANIFLQTSHWGRLRDAAFNLYQQTLPLGLGVGGLLLLTLGRCRVATARTNTAFWAILLPLAFVLGIAVHPSVVDLGMAHICLQPLVLLGLAGIAAQAKNYRPGLRWIAGAALGLDFTLGIGLHFAVQAFHIPPWKPPLAVLFSLNDFAVANYSIKIYLAEPYLADLLLPWRWPILAGLGLLLAGAGWRSLRPAARAIPFE